MLSSRLFQLVCRFAVVSSLTYFVACDKDPAALTSEQFAILSDSAVAPIIGDHRTAAPDRFIVRLAEDVSDPEAFAKAAMHDLNKYSLLSVYHSVKGFAVQIPEQALNGLRHNPKVLWIERDQILHLTGVQTTPIGSGLWGLDRIDQATGRDTAYHYDENGAGSHIYILDTGVDSTQQEFSGRIGLGFNKTGAPYVPCHGHGTYVAGVAAGATHGVAKGATIHSVRVNDGCTGDFYSSDVAAGLDWINSHTSFPAVINISIAGQLTCYLGVCGNLYEDEVREAVDNGITVVVGAGNDGNNSCNYTPARVSEAITVGATDVNDNQAVWTSPFASNYGSCIDIYAPGTDIETADQYTANVPTTQSGTSLAAPFVTGVVANYLQFNSSASPATVADQIIHASTSGVLSNTGPGSPNRLLNSNVPGNPTSWIEGPTTAAANSCTWNAGLQYGRGPFTYQWSGVASGSASSLMATVSQAGYLYLTITDAKGRSTQSNIWVDVDSGARSCY